MNLNIFNQSDFLVALRDFFAALQVPINMVTDKPISVRNILENSYQDKESFRLMDEVYFLGMVDDGAFRGCEGLDLAAVQGLEEDYDGIVIFGVTLKRRDQGKLPTRSQLAEISRAFNREFWHTPVVVVFRYGGVEGEYLAFANTERSQYKQQWREGEKAGKVTILRDINIRETHVGHQKILAELRIPTTGKDRVDSFAKLYAYWRKVLDVSLLNKEFYKEVSNWYFNACKKVIFPKDAKSNQESLIRLITRLMFVWFLKEKGLVPDDLFKEGDVRQILRSLEPQESSYYKAILQNLFFATLNTEWGKRKFIKESSGGRNSQHMVHNVLRYRDYFSEPDRALLDYFVNVPFLNGGLFECLDVELEKGKPETRRRIDGFSNGADNVLSIPNELFFGEVREVDLNADFGTSRKKYRVRGLIDIFNGYKFTIAENTPFEEDVALDPELLGQVFENLLAAYNPETQTTARKQTGSFYTPREIVNYMVDESLIAYFKEKVERKREKVSAEVLENRLRLLLDYQSAVNPFGDDEATTLALIAAIDGCKILDPACGSGAFPMGVLQKMVHILSKLDPHNERWCTQQKEKAIAPLLADIQTAEKISYEAARERAIAELQEELAKIEASFENEMDYPRKLFLIQNCIFGVDIQPIAVQISKLRFFISLIIDQKEDHDAENRGILPLPNLETKFVAANTLIGMEKVDQLNVFLSLESIETKKRELEKLRREHFFARSLETKRKKRDLDRQLRQEIGQILKDNNYPGDSADKLAAWEPYNATIAASFFDPEWMFGIGDGFDVVIGNPPYGAKITDVQKKYFNKDYQYQDYQLDSYLLFIEKSFSLAKKYGQIVLIIPNTWLLNLLSKKIRKWLFKEKTFSKMIHFKTSIFAAVVDTEVIIFSNKFPDKTNLISISLYDDQGINVPYNIEQKRWSDTNGEAINIFETPEISIISDKLRKNKLLEEICFITQGAKPFQVGKGKPPQTKEILESKPFVSNYKKDETFRPLLRGSLINKYQILWNKDYWISFGDWLAEPRYSANYDAPEKIVIRQTGDSLVAALDDKQFIIRDNLYSITSKSNEIDIYFLISLINSPLLNWFYQTVINPERGEALAQVKRGHLARLPIIECSFKEQAILRCLVKYIIYLKELLKGIPSSGKEFMASADDQLMLSYFEQIIDAAVMELYLPEELHTGDKYFMRHLLSENLPNIDKIKGDKIIELRVIFRRLFNRDHPIRTNIYFLGNLDIVKIIRGQI